MIWCTIKCSRRSEGEYNEEYNEFNYFFVDQEAVEDELQHIIDTVGLFELTKLHEFFRTSQGYNENILKLLEYSIYGNYADYELGVDILKCIKRTGECSFTAEA